MGILATMLLIVVVPGGRRPAALQRAPVTLVLEREQIILKLADSLADSRDGARKFFIEECRGRLSRHRHRGFSFSVLSIARRWRCSRASGSGKSAASRRSRMLTIS